MIVPLFAGVTVSYPIDETYIRQVLTELVQTDSTNPALSAAGAGEREIAQAVAQRLRGLGLEPALDEVQSGRWNVTAVLRGNGAGRSLLLNAHLDTVGVEGMADPFSAAVRDGRLYGRGSYDMKGSIAAMLGALKALVDGGVTLGGDLIFTVVADEEHASVGMEALVQQVTADAAIVTEPTDLQLCRAHRGFIWYEVQTHGRAAHGSRFREGIDANMRMGRFLAALDGLEQDLRRRPPHALAGPPSLHAALLEGGTEISVYADRCTLRLERRTIPGETVDGCTAELQAIIDRLAHEDETFQATVRPYFHRYPLQVDAAAPVVQTVQQAAAARLGATPPHVGQTYWTDAALLAAAGIETVIIGPKGAGLHSAEEWVDLASVNDLAWILAETAVRFCD